MKLLRLALLLLIVPLLSGCFGQSGTPLPVDRLYLIRDQFEELDRLPANEIDARLKTLQEEVARLDGTKDRTLRAEVARKCLLVAYCWERRGDFTDAQRVYAEAATSEYGSLAYLRSAQLAEYLVTVNEATAQDTTASAEKRLEAGEMAKLERKRAQQSLERAANFPVQARVLLRTPPVATEIPAAWTVVDIRPEAYQRLDVYYREKPSYKVFQQLVQICGGTHRNFSFVLAIALLALLAKLITTPLSAAQFRSMRAMQRVQPELKKLQEKYKNDKQQMGKAQMELFKQAGVNPFSSCLPMLIQMPILIWVYYAIRYFVFRFEGVEFLYIKSLANPDVLLIGGAQWPGPLLALYAVSMFFSQKLIATPATSPEQEQQQKMMTYLMPVMFLMILKGLPAAFILYWLIQNILMTGHQWLMMRSPAVQLATAGASSPPTPVTPKGGGPPPEALERLSRGSSRKKNS